MDEEKFEIIILQTNADTGEVEQTMHRRDLAYIPTEYQLAGYQHSWKKCHCGRQTRLNDLWCPSCGQKLGMPDIYDE